MYAMRFPGEDLSHTTMRQLLGMEGTRVAALYTAEVKRNDIQWHGRKWVDILPRMNAGDSRISRFGFLFDTTKQEGRGR